MHVPIHVILRLFGAGCCCCCGCPVPVPSSGIGTSSPDPTEPDWRDAADASSAASAAADAAATASAASTAASALRFAMAFFALRGYPAGRVSNIISNRRVIQPSVLPVTANDLFTFWLCAVFFYFCCGRRVMVDGGCFDPPGVFGRWTDRRLKKAAHLVPFFRCVSSRSSLLAPSAWEPVLATVLSNSLSLECAAVLWSVGPERGGATSFHFGSVDSIGCCYFAFVADSTVRLLHAVSDVPRLLVRYN